MLLQPGDHVLFYGDSITDCGRNRDAAPNDSAGWGFGYAHFCAARLQSEFAEWDLTISNKGVSGNRVYDLEERLERDLLALHPTLVSILIGINDTWRRYDAGVPSPIEEFEASYRRIVTTIQDSGARLVILEPFLLPVSPAERALRDLSPGAAQRLGLTSDRRTWREDLSPRIEACRDVARDVGALYIPLDGLFAQAACRREPAFWLPDGVHPSSAGHALITDAWLSEVVGA